MGAGIITNIYYVFDNIKRKHFYRLRYSAVIHNEDVNKLQLYKSIYFYYEV